MTWLILLSHFTHAETEIQGGWALSTSLIIAVPSSGLILVYTCLPLPWRRQWHPTPVLLPGKSHGRRSLVGYSPWGHEESDTTEWLHFHFSLSCIGEGNSNPLQCSSLENPRDSGAWWTAIYGVAQSWTWLKQLSSSSSSNFIMVHSVYHCILVVEFGISQILNKDIIKQEMYE